MIDNSYPKGQFPVEHELSVLLSEEETTAKDENIFSIFLLPHFLHTSFSSFSPIPAKRSNFSLQFLHI